MARWGEKKSDFQQIGYLKDIPKQNRHPTKNKKHRYGFKPRKCWGEAAGEADKILKNRGG